jgi:ABC-type phosphate/phosphonate transport system substrate-binding protein
MRTTRQLWQRYAGLLDQLNRGVRDFRVQLASALTESTYEDRLKRKQFDIAIVEPHRVLEVEDLGYRVFARAGNEDRVGALIVVRRDSNITRLEDLKGKTISFPSRGALVPTMLVRLHLARAAFDPNRDANCDYTGSQESALLNVYLRSSSAAAVSKSSWNYFAVEQRSIAADLDPRWQTRDLPGAAFMASERVPLQHLKQFQTAFATLRETPAGRAALTQAGFSDVRHGETGTYDALWEFMNDYRRRFGRLPALGDLR